MIGRTLQNSNSADYSRVLHYEITSHGLYCCSVHFIWQWGQNTGNKNGHNCMFIINFIVLFQGIKYSRLIDSEKYGNFLVLILAVVSKYQNTVLFVVLLPFSLILKESPYFEYRTFCWSPYWSKSNVQVNPSSAAWL